MPQSDPYYCRKHFKICRPVTTIVRHLKRYTEDTIKRIEEFGSLRKNAFCEVINDDSRSIDIFDFIARKNEDLYKILEKKKLDGIFTSPPYVGQIDYHEQHAYAYELFNIERKDNLEIGRQANGTSRTAQSDYAASISAVLLNVKKYLKRGAHIFIVANDNRNLYPTIAGRSGLKIVEIFKRPVLNRTERDKQPYSESIFHMVSD
jgi:DNA modification methylase